VSTQSTHFESDPPLRTPAWVRQDIRAKIAECEATHAGLSTRELGNEVPSVPLVLRVPIVSTQSTHAGLSTRELGNKVP
jgi:hypothetical protein